MKCAKLETVNLEECGRFTDAAAAHVAKCPRLQGVSFAWCGYMTDASPKHLAKCPHLLTANFAGTRTSTSIRGRSFLALQLRRMIELATAPLLQLKTKRSFLS